MERSQLKRLVDAAAIGKAYLCGPMTNVPGYGLGRFDDAEKDLRARGINVVTPLELDGPKLRELGRSSRDGDMAPYLKAARTSRGKLLGRDVRVIIDECDSVIVLAGWNRSAGALLETYAAWVHGKPIFRYPALRKVPPSALFAAWTGAHG